MEVQRFKTATVYNNVLITRRRKDRNSYEGFVFDKDGSFEVYEFPINIINEGPTGKGPTGEGPTEVLGYGLGLYPIDRTTPKLLEDLLETYEDMRRRVEDLPLPARTEYVDKCVQNYLDRYLSSKHACEYLQNVLAQCEARDYTLDEYTEYKGRTEQTVKVWVNDYKGRRVARRATLMVYMGEVSIINAGCMVKAQYSRDDYERGFIADNFKPLGDGETIRVNGRTYRVEVVGDYSDICKLTEVLV